MPDHNPGPVKLLFNFVMDLALYLSQSEDSVAAVHCKAGKGRTGIAICAYLLFMEAVFDTYEAIEFFNRRRTIDGKGLGVASQMRYLHYFEKFLKSTFKPPYKQLLCPYIKNPTVFDKLLDSRSQLKLMSICVGPFKTNPNKYLLKLQLSSFDQTNLFKKQSAYSGKFGR
jgi:phosphatidylinositol-3,4,5-trisphosphate 3-phosphatase/dual-specificity protein phosphatase PTEN